MMRSIKTRLLLGTIGAMAVLLVVFALVVYEAMQRSLVAGFDDRLATTIRTTSGSVDQGEEGVKCDPDERSRNSSERSGPTISNSGTRKA